MPHRQPNATAPDIFRSVKAGVPKYTLVVQGRFHAFALAKALIALEMPVHLITNYPAFMVEKFGVARDHVTGCAPLGLLHKYAYRWNLGQRLSWVNEFLHVSFSRWAAGHVVKHPPDVLHCFSGVALDIYDRLREERMNALKILARGSAHIKEQRRDMLIESRRANYPGTDLPPRWIVHRELEEYKQSDHIITLSTYAQKSFLDRGYSSKKVLLLPLGSNLEQFRASPEVIERRKSRLHAGQKLTVLGTGTFCLRKGALDLIEAAEKLNGQMRFQWVGNISPDCEHLMEHARKVIEFVPRVPEAELPAYYEKADVFILPTIEDGFAVTLAQAQAGGVPIVASDHCAAPDLIQDGETGWIVPVRRVDLLCDRLEKLDKDREMTIGMVQKLWHESKSRDWLDVGRDFLRLAASALREHKAA